MFYKNSSEQGAYLESYRTFLLDKNNKIQLVGSPVNNSKMWQLYKK